MQNIKKEPFKIIGISIRTTNEKNQAATDIGELWQRFIAGNVIDSIPNKVDDKIYSMYTDYEGDHTQPYTAILGCEVETLETIPEGMVGKAIQGGNYYKTSAKGDLTNGLIVNQWMKIWDMDIERVFTVDFEVFGEKAQNPLDAEVDFFVAIR